LRFPLREALRPLELERLLSLGAWVEESLSTRLDSVRAPDRLCVDEDRLEPDVRFREFPLELFDEDERPFDFEELRELPEPLLLDRDFCWGMLPLLLLDRLLRVRRLPESHSSNTQESHRSSTHPKLQFKSPALRVLGTNRRCERRSWHGKPREARNNGADNAILEQKLIARQLEDEEIDEQEWVVGKRPVEQCPVEHPAEQLEREQDDRV
jgi:hypothetical protein